MAIDNFGSATQQQILTGGDGVKLFGWNALNVANTTKFDANISNFGQLTIENKDSLTWVGNTEGVYLYKDIAGDFTIEVLIATLDASSSSFALGLIIRDTAASVGIDHIAIHWQQYNNTVQSFHIVNNIFTGYVTNATPNVKYYKITRTGNVFKQYFKVLEADAWTELTSFTRNDFAATVQVGIGFGGGIAGATGTVDYVMVTGPVAGDIDDTLGFQGLLTENMPQISDNIQTTDFLIELSARIEDALKLTGISTTESIYGLLLLEVLNTTELANGNFIFTAEEKYGLAESLNFAESLIVAFAHDVLDSFDIADATLRDTIATLLIAEQITLLDTLVLTIAAEVLDALGFADFTKADQDIIIRELLSIIGESTSLYNGTISVFDGFKIAGVAEIFKLYLTTLTDGFSVADSFALVKERFAEIMELVQIVGSLTTGGSFTSEVLDGLTIEDFVVKSWDKIVLDGANFAGAATSLMLFSLLLADIVGVSEVASDGHQMVVLLEEAVVATDTTNNTATLDDVIAENINLTIQLTLDGLKWQCWVLNGDDFKPSLYTNFDFNSFATVDGKIYGLKSDGIYRLDGTTDDGVEIESGIVFAKSNFGTERNKRFRAGYFGLKGNNVVLKVETENGLRYYEVAGKKAAIGSDIYGKDWTFTLRSIDELNFTELFKVLLSRRA